MARNSPPIVFPLLPRRGRASPLIHRGPRAGSQTMPRNQASRLRLKLVQLRSRTLMDPWPPSNTFTRRSSLGKPSFSTFYVSHALSQPLPFLLRLILACELISLFLFLSRSRDRVEHERRILRYATSTERDVTRVTICIWIRFEGERW